MSIQVEQTTPRKVCTRVAGELEEHGPGENGLKHLCSVVVHDISVCIEQAQ